jgi:hypothetical protein
LALSLRLTLPGIDAITSGKDGELAPLLSLLEELRRGVLPTQQSLIDAETLLEDFQQQSHASVEATLATPFADILLNDAPKGSH